MNNQFTIHGEYRQSVMEYLVQQLGKQPSIVERVNQAESWSVGIAKFTHTPSVGLATHATIGLGEQSLSFADKRPFPGGIELVALTAATTLDFEKCLAALCFNAAETGRVCAPGEAFAEVLGQAIPGVTVPHIFATDPYIWQSAEHELNPFTHNDRTIYWVMVVPISDGELELLRNHGERALMDCLEQANADVTNLWRRSTI